MRDEDVGPDHGRKRALLVFHSRVAKHFVGLADVQVVLAVDADDPDSFSVFIVEDGMEGFKATHEERKVGMRGCNTGEIELKNCEVPAENLLGGEGKGLRVAMAAICADD